LLNKTPYEAWFKRKPKIYHLRVFRCITYSHIPKENWEKLEGKGEKCIFVGYNDESKGCCFYNPEIKKVIISRDVIFDKVSKWKWPDDLP